MTVRDQATQQVDQEIRQAAVARLFDLRDVLELIDDRLGHGAFAQQ